MSMPDLLISGPEDAVWTVLLAHGAGAGMETPFLARISELLVERGLRVARFEFGYMAARRAGGKRRPAPKAETLIPEYRAAVDAVRADRFRGRLAIGGKSMGGRVASMVADDLHGAGSVEALVCLGYPFHPPGMPEKTRTAHLATLSCPALIIQGERDPFGNRTEVAGYGLSAGIEIAWSADGDHDLGPRGASGFTRKGNLAAAADAVTAFLKRLDE
jgi:predicted alpha/beta-hydrolase family hydrolase